MALEKDQCPQGYYMINGICIDPLTEDCCGDMQELMHECSSHLGWCQNPGGGCVCTQQSQQGWSGDTNCEAPECSQADQEQTGTTEWTYCVCSPSNYMYQGLLACCGYGGRGSHGHGFGDWGGTGGRGRWAGGGKIKRRGRR